MSTFISNFSKQPHKMGQGFFCFSRRKAGETCKILTWSQCAERSMNTSMDISLKLDFSPIMVGEGEKILLKQVLF